LPEGTREITVPEGFRFNVDGKSLSVSELKPGMAGTATITTKTTVVPVTVTEVKNGVVMQNMGSSILVRTDQGMKMFSQGDMDKRGVKIMKDGKAVDISELRANDQLTATIVTSKPPRILTEKQVRASLAKSAGGGARPRPRPLRRRTRRQERRRRRRRRDLSRKSCPRPPALCRFLGSWALRRSLRGWASLSGGVAPPFDRFPFYAGPALATGARPARRSRRAVRNGSSARSLLEL